MVLVSSFTPALRSSSLGRSLILSKHYFIFNEVCTSHSSLTILPQWGHFNTMTARPSAVAIISQIPFRHAGHLTLHISCILPQSLLDF